MLGLQLQCAPASTPIPGRQLAMYRFTRTLIVVSCIVILSCRAAAGQPADTEGASLSTMPLYVQWVNSKCGYPAKVAGPNCTALKDQLCGTRDTSEVLCLLSDKGQPEARFRSASRYTRVGYLRCSLTELKCATDPETYTGPAHFPDPVSLAAWVDYSTKCFTYPGDPRAVSAAECAKLSAALCSRPGVKCGKEAAEFVEVVGGKVANKVVLRGDYKRGLVFLQ